MRRIVFKRNKGMGSQPYTETMEFEDNATDEEIHAAYVDWVWQECGDEFTWYEEGEEQS